MSTYAVAFASNGDIGENGADFVIGWAVPVGAISELKSVLGDPVLRLECTDFRSIDLRFESASAARVFRRDINKISIADCTNETSFVFAHRRASTDEELNAWFPTDWLQQVHAPSRIRKWKSDRKGTEEPLIGLSPERVDLIRTSMQHEYDFYRELVTFIIQIFKLPQCSGDVSDSG